MSATSTICNVVMDVDWGDVATWFSGIASLAAVVTALYIARRSDKPQAKGSLDIYLFPPDLDTRVLMYQVSNLGTHSIYIHNCFLEFKPWVRRWMKWGGAVANDWRHPFNNKLPANIQRGESFRYGTAEKSFGSYLGDVQLPPWLIIRLVRAGVGTPWGPIYVKIGQSAREEMQRQILDYRRER